MVEVVLNAEGDAPEGPCGPAFGCERAGLGQGGLARDYGDPAGITLARSGAAVDRLGDVGWLGAHVQEGGERGDVEASRRGVPVLAPQPVTSATSAGHLSCQGRAAS